MARRKRKTAVVTLRIEQRLKVAAEKAADRDQRSLTNFIEVLILQRCKMLNIEMDLDDMTGVGETNEQDSNAKSNERP